MCRPEVFLLRLSVKTKKNWRNLKAIVTNTAVKGFNDWVACFQAFRSRLSHASLKQKQNSVSHGLQLCFFLPSLSFLDLYWRFIFFYTCFAKQRLENLILSYMPDIWPLCYSHQTELSLILFLASYINDTLLMLWLCHLKEKKLSKKNLIEFRPINSELHFVSAFLFWKKLIRSSLLRILMHD